MDVATSILVGVGLAAACGFRVFAPLLVVSAASLSGYLPMSEGFEWIATWPALLAFATATLLEIGAFYVPWLDNFLDSVAAPAAVLAGVMVVACSMADADPVLRWGVAIIAGGGAAGGVHTLTAATRGGSSVVTAGVGNPIIATVETASSFLLSSLSLLLPVLALLIVAVLLYFAFRLVWKIVRRRRRAET
jgi:hypothetical protein